MNQKVKKLLDEEATRRGLEIEEWKGVSPSYYAKANQSLTGTSFFVRAYIDEMKGGVFFVAYVFDFKSFLAFPKGNLEKAEMGPWLIGEGGISAFLSKLKEPIFMPPVSPYNGQKLDLSLMIDKGAYRETMVKNKKIVVWNE